MTKAPKINKNSTSIAAEQKFTNSGFEFCMRCFIWDSPLFNNQNFLDVLNYFNLALIDELEDNSNSITIDVEA